MNLPPSIAIIGAGIAGLTTAFTLGRAQPTSAIDVYEANAIPGGAIRTESVGGFLIEHGADMFATEPAAGLNLCRDLGIEAELLRPELAARGAAIVHRGRLVRIPDGFVLMRPTRYWPMMQTQLLSPLGKCRLLAERFIRRRSHDDDESIASFVRRRCGNELLKKIVQPLIGGIYTGDVERLSMAATMPQFWEMERRDGSLHQATVRKARTGDDAVEQQSAGARYEKFRSFPKGMTRLIDALVAALPAQRLHLSSPVRRLSPAAGGWTLQLDSGQAATYDQVVLAVPAFVAAHLVAGFDPPLATGLRSIQYASSAVVAVGVHESSLDRSDGLAGFVVPACEQRPILAVSYTGNKFPGRTPPEHRLLRVFIGGQLQSVLLEQTDSELIALATEELRSLLHLRDQPVLTKVIRWTRAMPQYEIGHLNRLGSIQQQLAKHHGLALVGNYLHGVGIAPTIGQARDLVLP